eukprot:Lithocolla_globosa_v1_NODE_172_length_5458_cov_46.676106.p5 type:complete len:107 gc:universal NODE_172_length_5458_cov_46.676106:1881-1561(-)
MIIQNSLTQELFMEMWLITCQHSAFLTICIHISKNQQQRHSMTLRITINKYFVKNWNLVLYQKYLQKKHQTKLSQNLWTYLVQFHKNTSQQKQQKSNQNIKLANNG